MSEDVECPTCQGRGTVPAMKTCARSACGAQFRWQGQRARRGARSDAIYCSRACAKAEAQKAYRQRARQKAAVSGCGGDE